MNPWGYNNYLSSVRHDMKLGMDEMGLSLLQSFGYAHNELALRLEEFPVELPLALIALAICLLEYDGLNDLDFDSDFVTELLESTEEKNFKVAISDISRDDFYRYKTDLERVKKELILMNRNSNI